MSINEPFHDPVDLLDELDAIIGEQNLLRQRVIALQARYRALEPYADRFDRGNYPDPRVYGSVSIDSAVNRLGYLARDLSYSDGWFNLARESAAELVPIDHEVGKTASTSGRDSITGHTLADLVNGRERDERDGAER